MKINKTAQSEIQRSTQIMRPQLNNILIIDDNKNDLELAQYYLNKKFDGLMFIVAESIADFKEKFSWLKPDLIISDYDLPDGTGLDILIDVKKKHPNLPFVFMSGTLNEDEDSLSKSILNGANGYLLKDQIQRLPDIIAHVMEDEYKKREAQDVRNNEMNKIKLKLSKSIEMLKSGAPNDTVMANLEWVKNALDTFES